MWPWYLKSICFTILWAATTRTCQYSTVQDTVQDTVQYSTPPHLAPRVESVQLQLARDRARGLVAVRGRARTRAVNIRRHEVELLAILVGHNISSCGPGRK